MAKDLSTMIDDVKLNVRVGAILEYQGKILIEKCGSIDFAVIPGGRIQTEENSKDALVREIQEELGIDINNEEMTLMSVIENFFEFENKKYHELYFVYKVILNDNYEITDGMENQDSHKSNYYLIDYNELENVKMLPEVLKTIAKSNSFESYIVNE